MFRHLHVTQSDKTSHVFLSRCPSPMRQYLLNQSFMKTVYLLLSAQTLNARRRRRRRRRRSGSFPCLGRQLHPLLLLSFSTSKARIVGLASVSLERIIYFFLSLPIIIFFLWRQLPGWHGSLPKQEVARGIRLEHSLPSTCSEPSKTTILHDTLRSHGDDCQGICLLEYGAM